MKQEFRFNKQGQERKSLVSAMSELLCVKAEYLGAPGFGYRVGEYSIDKEGTVTGEHNLNLFVGLAERGFEPEATTIESDQLTVEVTLEGFTPEAIDNLCKMVIAKESLIKKALGADDLPIQVLEDRISFPWFKAEADAEHINAYSQFIGCLTETAKKKRRVTAKAPADDFENERFTMRVWLIGLGMIGKEYSLARKLLTQELSGNSAWRYGAPEKVAPVEKIPEPETEAEMLIEGEIAPPEEVPAPETTSASDESEVAVDE